MTEMDRRSFLKALGWSAVGVTVLGGCQVIPPLPSRMEPEPDEARESWVQVRPDGRISFASPKQEMGQGVAISFTAIVAEELDVPLERVELILPDTARLGTPVPSTVGSESIELQMDLIARTAATVRDVLLDRASRRFGVSRVSLTLEDGMISAPDGTTATYGELAEEQQIYEAREGLELRSFRPAEERRHVGRGAAIRELEGLVQGVGGFVDDVRIDGMLHGAVLKGPTIGARPKSADFSRAKSKPGWVGGVFDDDMVGVVAEHRHQLDAIAAAVDVEWEQETRFDADSLERAYDVDRILEADEMEHDVVDDDVDVSGDWSLDMRVDVPFAAHAAIEPRCSVAEPLGEGRWRIHASTQDAFLVKRRVAFTLGISADDVEVVSYRLGGAFGSKGLSYTGPEAAVLAREVGAPVKVRWTRGEEFHEGFHRPPSSHRIRARVENGRVSDWYHAFSGGHVIFTHAGGPRWMLGMATTFSLDDGVSRGSLPLYDFGAKRIVFRDVPLPIRTGPWRGLGAGPNALAIELAVSRLAAVADVDPVEFRLRHLADESRLARCIRRVAEASGWSESNRGALPDGSSLGIGAGIYKGTTFAAAVARVARRDGELHVTDIWCAHDCGLVVNPDQVAAQVEGNLMWATSSVLLEELPIGHSIVDASNFSDSPILRIDDAPRIHVDLVDNAVDPGGAGESAIVPGFGAVANAWERATDEPITRIPVRST